MQRNRIASAAGVPNSSGAVMLRRAPRAGRGLRAVLTALAVALGLSCWLAAATAHAAPEPPYTVTLAPGSTVAGSADNALVFTFTALRSANTIVSVRVPTDAGWTAPQNRDVALPGYVSAAPGTCQSAEVTGLQEARTITVSTNCENGDTFTLTYAGADAATVAGSSTFTTKWRPPRRAAQPRVLSPQPVVSVDPAAAQTLEMTGLVDAVAGTEQSATVTARDAYGNIAAGYRGTVRIVNGAGWGFAGGITEHTFTAGDAGVYTFHVARNFAGEVSLTATDTATSTLTGSQTITISPGPTTHITMAGIRPPALVVGQTVRINVTFFAADTYGNVTPDWNNPVHVRTYLTGGADPISEQDIDLENGLGTIGVDVTIKGSALALTFRPTTDPSFGFPDLEHQFVTFGVRPNPNSVQLNISSLPNPDGTYNGTLDFPDVDMQVDPSSISFDLDHLTRNANGTSTVPFTGTTLNGDRIAGIATLTTPANPLTGTLSLAPPQSGNPLVVTGCLNQTPTTPGQFVAPAGSTPIPSLECNSGFLPTNTIPPNTPTVLIVGLTPQVVVMTNVTGANCADETLVWDTTAHTCVPRS